MNLISQQSEILILAMSAALTYPAYKSIIFLYRQIFVPRSLREMIKSNPWKVIGYNELRNEYFIAETTVFDLAKIAIKRFFGIVVMFIVLSMIMSNLLPKS